MNDGVGYPRGRRGIDQPRIGTFNQAVILDQIRRAGGLSRIELAAATGLSAQTVSNVCQRLLEAGVIEQGERSASVGPGKPRVTLRLVGMSRLAIGVHIDPAVLSVVLMGIDGEVVAERQHTLEHAHDPSETVRLIASEIELLIEQADVERARITGIGVAVPGPIDYARGVVADPPNLADWHMVPLRDALAAETGLAVILDKDVTAAAVAERWMAPTTLHNFAFLYVGTGLGVGLVINDDVVRGGSGNVGEIGHIVVDSSGGECECGQRGCIAVCCTPQAFIAEAEALGILPGVPAAQEAARVPERVELLVAAARGDNAQAEGVLERGADRIARALAVVTNLLDVDHVIVGGPYWDAMGEVLSERIEKQLGTWRATRNLQTMTISQSSLGRGVGAMGAACLVLDESMTPRTRALLLD